MKRFFIIIILILVLFALTACIEEIELPPPIMIPTKNETGTPADNVPAIPPLEGEPIYL